MTQQVVKWWTKAIAVLALVGGCGDDGGTPADASSGAAESSSGGPAGSSEAEATSTGESGVVDESSGTDGPPPDDPGDPFDPPPPIDPLPPEVVDQIGVDIDVVLADPAVSFATHGLAIIDLDTGQTIYEKNPDVALIPASNTKLFTTAAAMELFGVDYRIPTELFAAAAPDGAGNIAGDVHLIGHHDFTFSTEMFGGAAPRYAFDVFALQLFESGLRSVGGNVVASGEFVYAGESLGFYDPPSNRADAAAGFRAALIAAGITVGGSATTTTGFDPPGGFVSVGEWLSPPIALGSVPINVRSHNEFADVLMRHIGFEQSGSSTGTAGGDAVVEWVGSLGIDTAGMAFVDGSGLDRNNQVSPRQVVELMRSMLESEDGLAYQRTLAIGAFRGTLGGRLTGADTAGRFWGKTGTLTGVIATSGVLFNRNDGHRYLISILMNDTGSRDATRAIQDDVVEIVARDHIGDGPAPAAPTLLSARNEPDSTVVEVTFTEVPDVDGYLLWLSDDAGVTWNRADARLIEGSPYRAGQLPFGPDVAFRVTAVGPTGESDPSDAYSAASSFEASRVLIVDGFDRWSAQPVAENGLRAGHEFAARYGSLMSETTFADAGFDTVANELVADGTVALEEYDAVLWPLGEEGVDHDTFDPEEQAAVTSYLDAGGALLVTGAELGFDLIGNGSATDAAFMTDVLHVGYVGDDSGAAIVKGEPGPLAALDDAAFFHPGEQSVAFPDQLTPEGGATSILTYRAGLGGSAGTIFEGDHTVIVLGVPPESFDLPSDRVATMEGLLSALGL